VIKASSKITSFPFWDHDTVGSVTRADVQQLVNGWAASHAPPSTVRIYAVLREVMSFAEDSELITRSPCRRIRVPPLTPRLAEILDAEALARLAAAMGSPGPMVYLCAFGLRWGEIAGLRVSRLDVLRSAITVDAQVTRGLRGRMIESDPKTRAGRRLSLAIPDWLIAMLAAELAARGAAAGDGDAYVFVSPEGTRLHYSNWRIRVWLPARTAAGLPDLSFHDLKAHRRDRAARGGREHQDGPGAPRPRQSPHDPRRLRPSDRPGGPGGRR
jgi:integrase